jgi:hypothetical protein
LITHLSELFEGSKDAGRFRVEPESSQKDKGEKERALEDAFPNAFPLMVGAAGEPPAMIE